MPGNAADKAKSVTTRVISVASGKGGVGKTSASVNLAWSLGAAGRKVCILDADLGLSNVDILLGVSPKHTLEEVIFQDLPIEQAVLNVGPGVDLLAGESGVAHMADLGREQRQRLTSEFAKLSTYDYLIVDNSPGISPHVISLCLASEEIVVVITPEAASVTDAYALIKVLKENGLWRSPLVLFNRVRSLNQAKAIFTKFNETIRGYLSLSCRFLGAIPEDAAVAKAAALRTPLVEADRSAPAAMSLVEAARNLDAALSRRRASLSTPGDFVEQSVVRLKQRPLGPEGGQRPDGQAEQQRPEAGNLQRDLDVVRIMLAAMAAKPEAGPLLDDMAKLRRALDVVVQRHVTPHKDVGLGPADSVSSPRAVVVCPDVNLLEVLVELVRDAGFVIDGAVTAPKAGLELCPDSDLVVLSSNAKGTHDQELEEILNSCGQSPIVFVEGFQGRSAFVSKHRERLAAVVQRPFRIGELIAIFARFSGSQGGSQ